MGYATDHGNSTIGVMEEGEYEFSTSSHETMTVIEGRLDVQYPDQEDWKYYSNGESFQVEANSSFKVKAVGQTSYLCTYK